MIGTAGSWAQQSSGIRLPESVGIALFRLTGIDGYVQGRYWRDGSDTSSASGGAPSPGPFRSTQSLSSMRGDVFVMTHSYVYHPNLLLLDLGAGPSLLRQGYATEGVPSTSRHSTYNLSAHATVLRDKPARGALYYERKNDAQPVGPAQSLLTENTRYGFDLALLTPLMPMPMFLDASRFRNQGRGAEQVIDDHTDEINFRTERRWGKAGETRFTYQALQNDSRSGSVGLPIQSTRSQSGRADLDTHLTFGERNRYGLFNTVAYSTQDYSGDQGLFVSRRDFRFDVNLRAGLTDALETYARYQFNSVDQHARAAAQTGRLNAVSTGATFQASKDLSATLDAQASLNRSTAIDASLVGVNGSVQYRYELPLGEIAANYGIVWQKRDQSAAEPVAQVVGERISLSGVAWVTLRSPQVVASSVVVSNAPRTQIFAEGRDYTLSALGLRMRIQRVVGGAISDGQEVLVDYAFDTGGTYAVTELDHSIDLAWRYKSYFSIYARYSDASPRLDSGTPTTPLNPATTKAFGMRADFPLALLSEQVQLGGSAERMTRREILSPYQRSTFEVYAESTLPLIARGGLRVGTRRQETLYDLTPEQNVTQRALTARIWSSYRSGLSFSIEGTWSRDAGSPQLAREYAQAKARATWRIRRFLLTAEAARTKETQGINRQKRTYGQIDLRRDF